MKRPNLLALLLAVLFGVQSAHAGALVIPNTYSTGETITASSFNADNDAIETWAAGNVGSDNITDGSVASVDITNGTIVAADVATNTLTTSELGTASVDTDELASNAVTTAKITDANVTEAKIALDAAQVTYKLTEGTMSDGSCTSAITMDVTGTRPTDNTVLKQTINPDDTDFASETVLVNLDVLVTCTANCSSQQPEIVIQCNWDVAWDDWRTRAEAQEVMGSTGDYHTFHHTVYITPDDGGPDDVFCVIWELDGVASSATYDYCAQMVVQHIKR